MSATPQQTEIVQVAADAVGIACRQVVAVYQGDAAGARDALLLIAAALIGFLTLLHKTVHPAATRREIANYLTLEFARRLDAWVRDGERNDWGTF